MHRALALTVTLLSPSLSAQTAAPNHAAQNRPSAPQIVTFDPPGSIDTFPLSINDAGQITGTYYDGTADHGFVRGSTGVITALNVAGAADTDAFGINASGEIVGYYTDSSNVTHGFVRGPSGSVTSFDPPGSTLTQAVTINNLGQTAGTCYVNGAPEGFVRDQFGNITTFTVPGAVTTVVFSISADGSVTGYYYITTHQALMDTFGTVRAKSQRSLLPAREELPARGLSRPQSTKTVKSLAITKPAALRTAAFQGIKLVPSQRSATPMRIRVQACLEQCPQLSTATAKLQVRFRTRPAFPAFQLMHL